MMTERRQICGIKLDDDNCYGTADYPLCSIHHEAFGFTVAIFALGGHYPPQEEPEEKQLSLDMEGVTA
jgi:hypothetical protein